MATKTVLVQEKGCNPTEFGPTSWTCCHHLQNQIVPTIVGVEQKAQTNDEMLFNKKSNQRTRSESVERCSSKIFSESLRSTDSSGFM